MQSNRRLLYLAVAFAACVGANVFVQQRISAVEKPAPVPLQHPLAELPRQLGDWKGEDRPISEEAAYGDEHVNRVYVNQRTGQSVRLWMIYSGHGLDRDHHPEVCMSVAGKRENAEARQLVDVPGHQADVLQYEFGGVAGSTWIFYWYYMLPVDVDGELDGFQRLYLRTHHRPSSATIQVFTPAARSKAAESGVREFVRLVDAALQPTVGAGAIRGNRRTQVTVKRSPKAH